MAAIEFAWAIVDDDGNEVPVDLEYFHRDNEEPLAQAA